MILDVKDIGFRYPGTDIRIFNELNFRIDEPGFYALFGPSGVGKTTLVKMISGKLAGFSGEILTSDLKGILYSYNLERLPRWSDIGEHLLENTPYSEKELLNELIDAFGLRSCLNSRFAKLSLGQQNRINLTRYLLQPFDILIMDESLGNVDEKTREEILLKIKEIFPEKLFLYISHNIMEVAGFCKQIWILRGSHRIPQMISVRGLNRSRGQASEKKDLESVMLEIVHAS